MRDVDDHALFRRGPVVFFRWRNAEGWPVEYASPNTEGIFGYTAAELMRGDVSYGELLHPDDLGRVAGEVAEAEAAGRDSFEHELYRIRRRDGAVRWLHDVTYIERDEAGDSVTHYLGYVIDVTRRVEAEAERRGLERQLLHAQKLESLGVLAGGIAHDFNNLLTGILGQAGLARIALDREGADPLEPIGQIEALTQRAADLTRQLLAYSGKGRFVVQPTDLSALVRDMVRMLEVVVSKKARLELDLAPSPPAVDADRAQMQQVIMNLITNASEALGGEEGTITLRTRPECHEEDGAPAVALEVQDSGMGMTEEVRARLFDPFFTTKETGRGLGLAAIQGIVRAHEGTIEVDSAPGRGTHFRLCFPASDQAAVPGRESHPVEDWRGAGTVLLVDDDEAVRRVARRLLEDLGFDVVEAHDGAEALEKHAEGGPFACVLLDVMMPKLDGREVRERLQERDPGLPIVLSSGYGESASSVGGEEPPMSFLQKPYGREELATAVRRAVGAGQRAEVDED
ncbi:MAG TPA: response regulator [Polyangiaceae bacterium LLY-WYZ-15_(1-7)]|nr:hypothetical protein [Myxococcales bacterium]MAT25524.1 hypothetical protein [Sandaracinus sp.]HJK93289.1 response regulator [Polyangiaceae bacterium LLY-WYZ-15_(1-7)]HJL05919.1 response regulator [Polyangiaceae bacterium LLY-WYZ-15_(1-7)]HJL09076.1 response regulator [Polyangiaceae bacterium LLY-WYZ-15_(1-7)]